MNNQQAELVYIRDSQNLAKEQPGKEKDKQQLEIMIREVLQDPSLVSSDHS